MGVLVVVAFDRDVTWERAVSTIKGSVAAGLFFFALSFALKRYALKRGGMNGNPQDRAPFISGSNQRRVDKIKFRGRVALAFCFLAVIVQMILNGMGVAHYYDSEPNFDREIGDRICRILDWTLLASMFVWGASAVRVEQAVLFDEDAGQLLPLVSGIAGLLMLFVATTRLVRIPISGEEFGFFMGWQFGVGWALVCWCFVFRK